MLFGVAVVTSRGEAFMWRVDRRLPLRLVAANALLLTDHARLVAGAAGLYTTRCRELGGKQDHRHENAPQALLDNPHRLYNAPKN